jgi:hypothetical protein
MDKISVMPGDVVWAKLPNAKPFLVVWKDDENVYTYAVSEIRTNVLENYETYGIIRGKYSNIKNSWFNLTTLIKIPLTDVLGTMMTLNDDDLSLIDKRLHIQMNRGTNIEHVFGKVYCFSEGDVVMYGHEKYYIYAIYDKNLYCYRVTKKLQEDFKIYRKVRINRKSVFMDFTVQKILDYGDAQIIDIASVNEMLYINRAHTEAKEIAKKKEPDKKCDIGTVFKLRNKTIMYLYQSNGKYYCVDLLTYKINSNLIALNKLPNEKYKIAVKGQQSVQEIVEYFYQNVTGCPKKLKELYES